MKDVLTLWIALAIVIGSCLIGYAFHHQHPNPHAGQTLYRHQGPGDAIQGLTSYLDCSSQPGTHPWYVEVESHQFFMGCQL
jgi:hypothetical protein